MKAKEILRFIGNGLLLSIAFTIFLCLVIALGIGAVVLLGLLGKWIGIGEYVFAYAVFFIAFWKAWDALAWVVGKIAEIEEWKKEKQYFESKKL